MRYSIFLLLFTSLLANIASAQTIKWTEDKKAAKQSSDIRVQKAKALLIFESPVDLTFDSSIENIEQPEKKDGKYFLYVSSGPQEITINYSSNDYYLNFGQIMAENTLPQLKSKEIKYFKIRTSHELEYGNVTETEKAKGNVGVPIGPNVSDALIVVKVFPTDLQIEISDRDSGITKQSKEKGKGIYKVFLTAPGNHTLLVQHPDFDILEIPIKKLNSKETRFYRVRKPFTDEEYRKITELSKEISFDKIKGSWAGSLIENENTNKTYLIFQEYDPRSKKLSGKLYEEGVYHNFSGMSRSTTDNTFQVTIKKQSSRFSPKSATIDLIFMAGIVELGIGAWITDDGRVKEINIMKVPTTTVPPDNSVQILTLKTALFEQINGTWAAVKNTKYVTSISVNEIDLNNKITGSIIFINNSKCDFTGIVNNRVDELSLELKISGKCNSFSGKMMLTLNNNKATGMLTSNTGSSSKMSLRRSKNTGKKKK